MLPIANILNIPKNLICNELETIWPIDVYIGQSDMCIAEAVWAYEYNFVNKET